MTYQVLARKWRPQSFAELVGQDHVVTALRNALREGRIAQAYLFSGIRGVGKTTAARVLAKALNCERGPAEDPCNECDTCLGITSGGDLDVLEIDAATYSKVEQVRELTESLRYGPANNRYKVVVLDEIHRLSRQAFDALLKIVEEPPAHLTFVFATTEIDAVPATVLSRCQEFHFRRVSTSELAAHLKKMCEAESIEASDTALRLIARAGEGSVRDSVSLLDQLATFGSGSISDDDAVSLLGGLDTSLFERVLDAILAGEAATISAVVHEIEEFGWDPRSAFSQFLSFVRDALHLASGSDPAQLDLPQETAAKLHETARQAGYENLLRLLNHLLESENLVRRSEAAALALEICWLRAAELPKLIAVESLLAGGTSSSPAASGGAPSSGASGASGPSSGGRSATPRHQSRQAEDLAPPHASSTSPLSNKAADGSQPADAPASDLLQRLNQALRQRRPALAAYLNSVQDMELTDQVLEVAVPPADDLTRSALERSRDVLDEVLKEIIGPEAKWRITDAPDALDLPDDRGSSPPPSSPSPEPSPRPRRERPAQSRKKPSQGEPPGPAESASDDQHAARPALSPEQAQEAARDPAVQAVLDVFGGKVESVEPRVVEEQ